MTSLLGGVDSGRLPAQGQGVDRGMGWQQDILPGVGLPLGEKGLAAW